MYHQYQTQTQTSNTAMAKENQPKPMSLVSCLMSRRLVALETGSNLQNLEAKKSIPSSIKCSHVAFPTHIPSEANSDDLSSLCSSLCQSFALDQSMDLSAVSHVSDFFCGTDNFISFHRLDQDLAGVNRNAAMPLGAQSMSRNPPNGLYTQSSQRNSPHRAPVNYSSLSVRSGALRSFSGSLIEPKNYPDKTSVRCANCQHQCTRDELVQLPLCLHCILSNMRHGPLVFLFYGLQILILFDLLPRTVCFNAPIPRHIGCLELCSDVNTEVDHGDCRLTKQQSRKAGGASTELVSPCTHNESESESNIFFPCDGSTAKLELLSGSGDSNSEMSSLTSDSSIPSWSFEQVGRSLQTVEVEENTAPTDVSSIPSWSFIKLGESIYSSDVTLGNEEAKTDGANAIDDSTLPAWSYVKVGEALGLS
jgi:hypothetical protein